MNWNLTNNKEIRKFGFIAFVFFGCLCALGIWQKKPIPIYFFGFLSSIGGALILFPSRLMPVYVAWLKISHFIGKIFTFLILTLTFYLVITPIALIKRIFNGNPLPIKPNKKVSSYWIIRPEPVQSKERFLKRY